MDLVRKGKKTLGLSVLLVWKIFQAGGSDLQHIKFSLSKLDHARVFKLRSVKECVCVC